MKIDFLIKNGLIFDGNLSEPLASDVGLSGDKIVFINKSSGVKGKWSGFSQKAEKIIDAEGLSVAPGFIDTHAHSDFTVLADPRAEGKICQGITTEINGNCGLSAAPFYGDVLHQREDDLQELGIHERWSTFKEYFHILKKRGAAINFATLAGHGNIRASVKGYKDQELTKSDLKKMCALVIESVKEGAIGLSTGLIYPPGVYSKTEELIELCKVLSKYTNPPLPPFAKGGKGGFGIYTTHMRSEGDKLIESIEETIRIGKEAGIQVHLSHVKTSGKENWHKVGRVISLMEESRKEGISLTCDAYPYTASSTDLDTVLPAWVYSGGREGELKRLKNSRIREKIKKQILDAHPLKNYWRKIYISSVSTEKNKWMEGRSLHSIAGIKGKEPVEILFNILIEERLMVSAIFASMHEGNMKQFLSLPYCMIGTDSAARV